MLESKLSGWKEKSGVSPCVKVVVKGKGRDKSAEMGSVYDIHELGLILLN